MSSLNPQEIRQILDILESSGWDEAVVTVGDVCISVARNGATLGTASVAPSVPGASTAGPLTSVLAGDPPSGAAPPSPPPTPVLSPVEPGPPPAEGSPVLSPTVGLFWRSPQPGSPPFVEVGQLVNVGDLLCIVEVMKLMNNVVAEVSGVISVIHVANAAAVEYGQTLMTINPQNG